MQNLTSRESNDTRGECGLCVDSPIILPTVLPYILMSLPANAWVLWLMISSPIFWTDRMEVSEFHLVLTELLFGFLGSPLLTISHFSSIKIADKLFKFIDLMFAARIQFQSSVCVERYLAVVHPVLFLRFKPLRYRMTLCCVIWMHTVFFAIAQIFFCREDPESVGMSTAPVFCIFVFNSFCCLSVLRALKQPSPGEGERGVSNLIKKRAFNMVLIFQVTTFFSYVPLVTISVLFRKIKQETFCILQPLAYSMMIWLGAIYPLLYLRRAVKRQKRNDLCVHCFQK